MSKLKRFVNPDELLSQIVESDFDLTRFDAIDQSDIEVPPNFLEWITGRDFCNATLLPWQVEAGMHLFSDYCPECSNPEYTVNLFDETIAEIQDNVQFLDKGVCPKCKQTRLDLFTLGDFSNSKKPSLKNELIACLGQRSGKCLAESTPVMTPEGPVAIKDLKVGDTVYGYNRDGSISPTKVVNVFYQGVQQVTPLTYYNKELYACTDNHRWLLRTDQRKNRTGGVCNPTFFEGTINNLKKGIVFSRAFVKIPGGPVKEPHAYVLGALAGDGCSRQDTKNCISISSANNEVPLKISRILKSSCEKDSGNNFTWRFYGDKWSLKRSIYCNHYEEWIKGRYAHEKIIDLEVIKTWDRESRLELLAGLIDIDGGLRAVKNKYGKYTSVTCTYTSQSKSLIEAVQYLFLSLFQFRLYETLDNRSKYKNGPCFELRIKNNYLLKRAWSELNDFIVNPERKWKSEYDSFPIRNSNPNYINLSKGEPYKVRTYDIEIDNETSLFVLADQGAITHNSKFVVSAATYQLMKWLVLPDPTGFFNLPKMEVVLGTFSALSAEQAEENLWMPFKGLYDNSPWFKKYNDFLRAEEKRLSIPLVENKDTYIFYPHKRFMCSYTGSDDRKKRGRTRLWGAIDEIAFLNSEQGTSKKKVMDADKNYSALNNSLSTIRQKAIMKIQAGFYDTQMAIMYNASSPYNVQDKIMRLVKSPSILSVAIQRATWEANPDYTELTCRAMNPNLSQVEFDRDFGAIPPFSDSPFIGEGRVLEKLCLPSDTHQPLVDITREIHTDPMGDSYLYLKAKVSRIDKITPRLLSLDNGFTQNAFAAALFSFNHEKKSPFLNQMFSLYPDQNAGLNIHFPMMFEHFIIPLIQGLNIKFVFYDRWQSLDQIQRLRDIKVQAQAHSLSLEKDLLPFKQMLLSGNMILPPCELPIQGVKDSSNPLQQVKDKPVANLIWQTLTVRQVGRKLLKPLEGDDDMFRAFALGGSRFLFEDIQKQFQAYGGVRQAVTSSSQGFVGSFHSYRGGVAGGSSGGSGSLSFAKARVRSNR